MEYQTESEKNMENDMEGCYRECYTRKFLDSLLEVRFVAII